MELQMTYLHKHSFTPSMNAGHTLEHELADAEVALRHKRPGTLVGADGAAFPQYTGDTLSQPSLTPNTPGDSSLPAKKRHAGRRVSREIRTYGVNLPQYNFRCFLGEIPDPPNVSYSKNYRDLVDDWANVDCASVLVHNEGRVPLCAWDKVYKNNRPGVWENLKIRWRNWRVCPLCYH